MRTILYIFIAFSLLPTVVLGQRYETEREKGTIGIGYQISYPFHGLSIVVAPEMDFSFQGMIGVFGDLRSYCAKVRYHFNVAGTYSYGLVGLFSYKNYEYSYGTTVENTETIFGYGVGLGLEFAHSNIPIWTNFEVGYGDINFKNRSSKNYAIMVGIGLHFYLPEFMY